MDESQIERCVGTYGEDTSGQVGRGIFGMGLKDTINAFGEGVIITFKGDRKYRCTLKNVEDLEIEPSRWVSRADRREFRNTSAGTVVEIIVKNPKVKIPQIDSLRQQLQTHVCLRGIMTDPTRKIVLRDLRSQTPDGEKLLDAVELQLPSYPNIKPKLTVSRASGSDSLSQEGSYRRRSAHSQREDLP